MPTAFGAELMNMETITTEANILNIEMMAGPTAVVPVDMVCHPELELGWSHRELRSLAVLGLESDRRGVSRNI